MSELPDAMNTLLAQLNTLPGVVGGMLCDLEGRVISQAFPPFFDEAILVQAASVLADAPTGLESMTGKAGSIELRFNESRVVLKPMAASSLVLLCTAQANTQLLNISTSVAVPKLEKLVAAYLASPRPAAAAASAPVAPAPSVVAPAEDEAIINPPQEFMGYEKTFVKLDGWLRKHMK